MRGWQKILLVSVTALSAGKARAEIISEALLSFPARTEYVEYDNLASLRTLANYNSLKERFSGKPLEEAKIVLGQLEIQENQVQEIVTGSSSSAFYGVVSGTFSGEAAAKRARAKGFATKLLDTQAFCTGRETCIVFLDDSMAAFGAMSRLKEMLEARQGVINRLSSNRTVVELFSSSERNAPVRGVLFGSQLNSSISDVFEDWSRWKRDWSGLSANIRMVGYSIRLDSKAHVSATVECTSKTTAALLLQVLSVMGNLPSVPFQHLQATSSGSAVSFKADTAIPDSVAPSQ